MRDGYLKQISRGVAVKKLTEKEITPTPAEQLEVDTTAGLAELLGSSSGCYDAEFLYIDDERNLWEEDSLSWHVASGDNSRNVECRLLLPFSPVTRRAIEGDSLFICVLNDGRILCTIAAENSTVANQLRWLFELEENGNEFVLNRTLSHGGDHLPFVVRPILGQIGVGDMLL